jgi:hypothetical protein
MLKLTYTEDNFDLEYINQSWETWVNTRVLLALQSGYNIHIQNTTASFTVSDSLELTELTQAAIQDNNRIEICRCDTDFLEVTLKGMWISSNVESEEGVFVTALNTSTELCLYSTKVPLCL